MVCGRTYTSTLSNAYTGIDFSMCNAVIVAKPNARFLLRYLGNYAAYTGEWYGCVVHWGALGRNNGSLHEVVLITQGQKQPGGTVASIKRVSR